jgi:hypothetical protein
MGGDDLHGQTGSLEQLVRNRFGTLSAAEVKLARAAPHGQIAYCGPSHDDHDPHNDPGKADQWGPERQIRAQLIRFLCLDRRARERVDQTGIAVHAAKVVGGLNLSFVTVDFPLQLWHCALTDDANLIQLEIPFLSLEGSWVRSVSAGGASVKAAVFLDNGFHAVGTVNLYGANIGWMLDCRGGTFVSVPRKELSGSGVALNAENITVSGALFLSKGFRAEGEVRLSGAQIRGTLDGSGGAFINPPTKDLSGSGVALNAENITVSGNLMLAKGFRAEGEVRLSSAQIRGTLDGSGGVFINPPIKGVSGAGTALYADSITVSGTLFLSGGFHAEGEVHLVDAQISGGFDCTGGAFINPPRKELPGSGAALNVGALTVKGNVLLCEGFCAEGKVDLTVSRIAGDLVSRKGIFKAATLDLRDASANAILDDDEIWPERGNMYLDGFVYGRIAEGPRDAETRLKWLNLQPENPFARQPYLQLAKVLREAGDDDGARRVLIAMEDRQWETNQNRHWIDPLQRWPLRVTVGYGYRPLWAFWEILGLSALGWVIYRRSYLAGTVVPMDKDAYESFKLHGEPPTHYGGFAPLVYSVENSLPLVKLGQADKWQPDPNSGHPASPRGTSATSHRPQRAWPRPLNWLRHLLILSGLQAERNPRGPGSRLSQWGTSPRFLRCFLWIQIMLGWLLATLFLAGVTGIVRTN